MAPGRRGSPGARLLTRKKLSIRAAKSALLDSYLYRGLFPRARDTRVESPGGIDVEGST